MTTKLRPTRRDSDEGRDRGFTLIEVMVVVMIIGILLAIGVPTFLGARSRAQDRAAQTSLRTAQTTALVVYTDYSDFAQVTTGRMALAEPGITWLAGTNPSTTETRVSISVSAAGNEIGAAALADSGACFYIRLRESGSTLYGRSTTAACTGDAALTTATRTAW